MRGEPVSMGGRLRGVLRRGAWLEVGALEYLPVSVEDVWRSTRGGARRRDGAHEGVGEGRGGGPVRCLSGEPRLALGSLLVHGRAQPASPPPQQAHVAYGARHTARRAHGAKLMANGEGDESNFNL